MNIQKIKTALLSVSNKKKIIMIAKKLIQKKIKIFATTGTAKFLKKKKIKVTKISDYLNFPEILKGQVKTLHPKIYGGILAKNLEEVNSLKKYKIKIFDLIIINFYNFKINKLSKKKKINQITKTLDIGGPTIVRASIKNYKNKIIVTDIKDYIKLIKNIDKKYNINKEIKLKLAIKALEYITLYHIKILNFLKEKNISKKRKIFPKKIQINLIKKKTLRYGENAHQEAALYIKKQYTKKDTKLFYKKIQGKKLSYNNIFDAQIALNCVRSIQKTGCVIVKHGNPCGAAISNNTLNAYKRAYNTDPKSCFGGIIAFNNYLNNDIIKYILQKQFVEIIIAPKICKKAINNIKRKKHNIRILIYNKYNKQNSLEMHSINNKYFILQTVDKLKINFKKNIIVTKKKPNKKETKDLLFAWKIAKFTKSNSIVCVKNLKTTAIGCGQTSRIDAIKMARMKAKEQKKEIKKSVLASDGFLPFKDNIKLAAKEKISCIIQPGGSIRDKEIIKEANENNIAMIFTNIRHFKH